MVDGERWGNARLHDGIAFYDTPIASAESRPIERMRHGTDKANGSTPRQPCVRIECDHVANARNAYGGAATDGNKCSARRTAQELVQFMQLPSLALPAHPFAVTLVPYTLAMEEKKAFATPRGRTILFVQPSDSIHRDGDQVVITRQGLARRVQPIREQRETQFSIWICQIVHFQPLDMLCNFLRGSKQGGHDDNRPQVLGDAVVEFHARKPSRPEQGHYRAVDQCDRQVRGWHCGEQTEEQEASLGHALFASTQQRQRQDQSGQNGNSGQIARHRGSNIETEQPTLPGDVITELAFKGRAPSRDEMIARLRLTLPAYLVGMARIFIRIGAHLLDALHDMTCNFNFRVARTARKILDGVTVVLSRGEIHSSEGSAVTENFVYQADALNKFQPVKCRNQAHAGYDVAHGHAHGPLFLVFGADNLIGGRARNT